MRNTSDFIANVCLQLCLMIKLLKNTENIPKRDNEKTEREHFYGALKTHSLTDVQVAHGKISSKYEKKAWVFTNIERKR